jgi:outer membrane protein TolC
MDVKNAFLGRSEAATRLQVLQQAVAEAEESVRILSERYAEGMALTTELLDAEVALTNARLHELSAKYDYLIASAALERAVGAIIDEGSGQ